MAYNAVRYEPLCGNIGSDQRYTEAFDMGEFCGPAMDAYADTPEDTLVAVYDLTGTRLDEGIVGDGYDTCLCFALGQSGGGDLKSGICLWVDGDGQAEVWWQLRYDRILAGVHRPNMNRALPLCADVNVDELEASWSATAAGLRSTTTGEPGAATSTKESDWATTEYVTTTFTNAGK